jgi:hypothetical protein
VDLDENQLEGSWRLVCHLIESKDMVAAATKACQSQSPYSDTYLNGSSVSRHGDDG